MNAGEDMERDDDALAAEYALGVLPHRERLAFTARLDDEPALRERVRFWEEHFAPLSDEIEDVLPPARVLYAIQARIYEDRPLRDGWWNSLGFWRGLGLAAVTGLAVLAGAVLTGMLPTRDTVGPVFLAEVSGAAEDGAEAVRLVALYDQATGGLRVNRTAGAPAAGRALELWLIAGDDAPVSLGLLPADNEGVLDVPEDVASRFAGGVLAISDEPEGGSPTGQPTGAVLATGEITAI